MYWMRSPLGLLNFLILQWFGFRLARVMVPGSGSQEWKFHSWTIIRWVLPLTGWWGRYIWIKRSV